MTMPPDREAPAEHPIEALLRRRWSPRSFTGAPVAQAAIDSLLEAARWAASSSNQQPWHLILARRDTEPEAFARLLGTLAPGNQAWADKAGVLMLAVARMTNPANGNPNRDAFYDTGAAMAQMALQAAALGLQLHQMGGFDAAKAREAFGIPEGYEPAAAIALGHVAPAEALPGGMDGALAAREVAPRQRRPIGDWAFFGSWRQ
ncbi:nitroreductase family protein [Belnapia rosea]|uniref:Nitroreductase n=1 Tax=Belnapia rosea TaxID=938405 RepID=A0A1G6Y132_9PROT|nr:nitroreductase family protein [Belnapia rosea]SDD83427.1 Nitroreductase [Belnapia rosea]